MRLHDFDKGYFKEYNTLCGVDEAGRGALAGPVSVAAVVFDNSTVIDGLNDSKKLTPAKRALLYKEVIRRAIDYRIVLIHHDTVDKMNILAATLHGMKIAVSSLKTQPEIVLIDGNKKPDIEYKTQTIIKGDAKSQVIAAASILAKVYRDRYMQKIAPMFPAYSFSKHKGYATQNHFRELMENEPTGFHRKSFSPVKEKLNNRSLFD